MPADQSFQRIQQDLGNNPPVNVVLASRRFDEDEDNLQRITLGADLQQRFQRIATDGVTGQFRLLEYEPGYKPDSDEVLWIDLDDSERIGQVVSRVAAFQDLPLFEGNRDEFLEYLKYYVIFARVSPRRHVTLFRATSDKLILGHGSKIGAMFRDGSYDTVEETVFLFDRNIDCWSDGSYMFIKNVSNFERIFGFYEQLQGLAQQTVTTVLDRIPIANADAFRAACTTQRKFMTKLAAIASRPYFANITMNALRRTVRDHELDIEIVRNGGRDQLQFDPDPSRRWTLLKLLDDDYLN
jgi:hypothetical protein